MESNFKKVFLKNVSCSVFANCVSMIISIVMIAILPRLVSVEVFGLWNLFLFYFSFIGVCHLGWSDGIYLRYAGGEISNLNKRALMQQVLGVVATSLFSGTILLIFIKLCTNDLSKLEVIYGVFYLIPFVHFNTVCSFIFQITDKIKKYSMMLLMERISYVALVFLFIDVYFDKFEVIYFAKFLSVFIVTIYCIWYFKNLTHIGNGNAVSFFDEAKENIRVGSKLLMSNIAGILIIGIVRFGISYSWDVTMFGKISLALSISNFLMTFINSISVVLFPTLKKLDSSKYKEVYIKIRLILMYILFAGLMFFWPLKEILLWWLPNYKDSIFYLAVLFPICIYESRVVLLTNTYFKSLRKEYTLLKINVLMLILSFVLTIVGTKVLFNIYFMLFSILFLFVFKSILSEYLLCSLLESKVYFNNIKELLLILLFVSLNIFNTSFVFSICIYSIAYFMYIYSEYDVISGYLGRGKIV